MSKQGEIIASLKRDGPGDIYDIAERTDITYALVSAHCSLMAARGKVYREQQRSPRTNKLVYVYSLTQDFTVIAARAMPSPRRAPVFREPPCSSTSVPDSAPRYSSPSSSAGPSTSKRCSCRARSILTRRTRPH